MSASNNRPHRARSRRCGCGIRKDVCFDADFGENRPIPPGVPRRHATTGTHGNGRSQRSDRKSTEAPLKVLHALLALAALFVAPIARTEESDHAIHEELRGVLREVVAAMNSGQYDKMLPYLTENIEATSITQEVMSGRAEVSKYFQEWFGPTGYMRKMEIRLEADRLTDLSPDKSWGLVRGKALEHYEAKDGDVFDFDTRWTAVMIRGDDGKWRLRAIHFGTNDLDNPVLTKVQRTLVRYGIIAAIASLLVGLGVGWWVGRRRGRSAPAAQA